MRRATENLGLGVDKKKKRIWLDEMLEVKIGFETNEVIEVTVPRGRSGACVTTLGSACSRHSFSVALIGKHRPPAGFAHAVRPEVMR